MGERGVEDVQKRAERRGPALLTVRMRAAQALHVKEGGIVSLNSCNGEERCFLHLHA